MNDIDYACDLLKKGEIICLPTETVYGLAADATQDHAVKKIYALKGRPDFNPLISHVSSLEMAEQYGIFSPISRKICKSFWPGPLTIVVPKQKNCKISPIVTANLNTIALRSPDHPIISEIITRIDTPLAAPSANISGTLSPTDISHVQDAFGDNTPFIIDGGPCQIGLESTIIQVIGDNIHILRHGVITETDLKPFANHVFLPSKDTEKTEIIAPGQLLRHYAPQKSLYFDLDNFTKDDGFLAFGTSNIPQNAKSIYQLSETQDLNEAASKLFSGLHMLDHCPIRHIFIAPIPYSGPGIAINDRLKRASYK
ncbi:MAG: L-threonylcarbamoyladenylate synthase [Pseudomonadota bacterium]